MDLEPVDNAWQLLVVVEKHSPQQSLVALYRNGFFIYEEMLNDVMGDSGLRLWVPRNGRFLWEEVLADVMGNTSGKG